MKRKIVMMILLGFLIPFSTHAQNFDVIEAQVDLGQAVLSDRDMGNKWLVQIGDEIEGWQVVSITQEYVTLFRPREGMPALTFKIPVDKGKRMIQSRREGGVLE